MTFRNSFSFRNRTEASLKHPSFSITPETPIELGSSPMIFKVKVTDGKLEDYQEITVKRGGSP